LKIIIHLQKTYNFKNRSGTRGFMPPETIFNWNLQTKSVDIWAAGVILLSFYSKRMPVFNLNKFSPITQECLKEIYPLILVFGREKIMNLLKKFGKK
jgi:serine/threonine protein kinase